MIIRKPNASNFDLVSYNKVYMKCALWKILFVSIFCFYNKCFLVSISYSQDFSAVSVHVKELTSNISGREPCPAASAPAGLSVLRCGIIATVDASP